MLPKRQRDHVGSVCRISWLLWLFYQSDLDPSAELSYAAFARAIATLKRARIERAPFWRWMPAKFRDWKEFMRRPRVPRAHKNLVAQKEDEIHERIGAWTKVPHPEIKGSTYWVNPETGETSATRPRAGCRCSCAWERRSATSSTRRRRY